MILMFLVDDSNCQKISRMCILQGNYTRMANIYGDVWEASNFGDAPLSLRFTDNYGDTLTAP